MTARPFARRPLQLGGLLLAAAAFGTAAAPAALAEDTPAPQTDPAGTAPAPQVLDPGATTSSTDGPADATTTTTATTTAGDPATASPSGATPAPASSSTTAAADQSAGAPQVASTTTPSGAHFGTGKLDLSLDSSADPLPAGTHLDPAGGQLELRFSQVGGAPSTAVGICDLASGALSGPFGTRCTFQTGNTIPTASWGLGPTPSLPADSVFTLTLVRPPASGQLLAAPVSVQGWTDTTANPAPTMYSDLALPVQHGYRTLGAAVVDGAPAGTQVQLCPAVAGACATGSVPVTTTTDASGLATFSGRYLPGAYLVTRAGTATPFTVPAATTVTERDTALRLTLGAPVTAPPTTAAPTTATVASATLAPGRQQTVTLSGFTPGETVRGTLYSTPVDLGTAVADAQGVATFTFTVPAAWSSGCTP